MNSIKYVAFLRGINISGKNKISMGDLKNEFANLDYADISTYLNSGNILFSSEISDKQIITDSIEKMIKDKFDLEIPVYVTKLEELNHLLDVAPSWWGSLDKNKYDNLIFILTEDTPEAISNMIGPVSEGLEIIQICENAIFWSFEKKMYQKCNWWKKTATAPIADKLTIRTANTIKKVCK